MILQFTACYNLFIINIGITKAKDFVVDQWYTQHI